MPAAPRRTLYTSAPLVYDGFGTETLRVVGHDTRNREPVREVAIEAEHYEWQTTRYLSGSHRFTHERMALADYLRWGDWDLMSMPEAKETAHVDA